MKYKLSYLLNHYWDALLASSIAFVWILAYANHSGIGISPDSVAYLSAAENIASHFSFTDFNQLPFVAFPLGYPIFLALIKFAGTGSLIHTAPVINGILFSGIIFITSYIFQQLRFTNNVVRVLILLLMASSPVLLEVYSMLWSETLFIFCIGLFFIAFKKYLERRNFWLLMIAAFLAAVVFWVRYAGITCIITGGVLLLFSGNLSLKKKLLHLVSFSTAGILFTLINLIRNSFASGTYTGVREKALRNITDNIADLGNVLREWFPLAKSIPWLTILILVMVLMVAIGLIIYRIVQQQFFASFEIIIAVFVLIYTTFMLVISSISRFETLSSRLMSPVYVPLLILLGIIVTQLLRNRQWLFRIFLSFFLMGTYGFAQYHHYAINSFNWEGIHSAGIPGYTEDQWTKSPMVAYMRLHSKDYQPVIFSNANDAVYFLTGLNALALPHKEIPGEIIRFKNNSSFYLVWFFHGENPDLIDREFIQKYYTLKASWQFEDGIIYHY